MFHYFHTAWDDNRQYLMKYQNAHKLRDSISTSFDARIFLVNIYIINNLIKQNKTIKAGLHATICRPDLSARQCRSANRTCILTPDLRPIRENENRPDSENLLQCNRFLCSRADTFKEADMSIKILSREHAYKSETIKMADKKTPKRPKSRSFQEEEISLLISEWFKYPCLFDKGSKDYHDKNKREIARTHIARSLNEQLGFDKEVDSW